MGIVDFVREQLSENQFLQGGVLLGALGSVVYFLRTVPGRIWAKIKSRILFSVAFDSRDPVFTLFHSWVNRQSFVREKRNVRIITDQRKDPPEIIMTFGYGTYLVRHEGVWLIISQDKEKAGDGDSNSSMLLETYSITCMFWRRNVVMDLLSSIVTTVTDEVTVYQWKWGCSWISDTAQPKKSLEKLILRDGLVEEITGDMERFIASRDWYESLQIPYQRGYLMTGPAGTGKTTLAACLASEFRLRLCVLDMTDILDDGELRRALTSTPGCSIVLIEDFDSFFEGRKNKRESSKVTFSGLLNAINGIVSSQGRILILTTNREGELDPALARMGRIDKRFHLGYADSDQASRLFTMYHPSANGGAKQFGDAVAGKDLSPADLAGHFQACRNDQRNLMDIDDLIQDRDGRRDLSKQLASEAEAELAAKSKEAEAETPVTEKSVA